MILLELTEKEADILKQAIIKEKYHWEDQLRADVSKTLIDNNLNTCNSISTKLDLASQPQPDLLITSKDLFHIKSLAKGQFHELRGDLQISNKRVEEEDLVHISLANAVIMWLNGRGVLKKVARFDCTDDSFEYEESE
jgi:hypothetical protein